MRPARLCPLSSLLCLEVRQIILGLSATFLGNRRVTGKEQQCVPEVWGKSGWQVSQAASSPASPEGRGGEVRTRGDVLDYVPQPRLLQLRCWPTVEATP